MKKKMEKGLEQTQVQAIINLIYKNLKQIDNDLRKAKSIDSKYLVLLGKRLVLQDLLYELADQDLIKRKIKPDDLRKDLEQDLKPYIGQQISFASLNAIFDTIKKRLKGLKIVV